ncbi:MAG TPA: ATP-dependent DNA ligase [Patescibacteria group bacterium]|nr:ATP-dependent DNA ligase [Patescibacteria group bacterium]
MRFSRLASYLEKLEETTSRNLITEILAEVFREAKPGEIGKLCYLLQGRVAPLYEAVEFGVAEKFIIRAIAKAYDVPQDEVAYQFKKLGDIGKAAEEIQRGRPHFAEASRGKGDGGDLKVSQVFDALYEIAVSGGEGSQEKKITFLADLFARTDSLSSRYLARIPLDKLRLGFSETTILDALSWMLVGDKTLRMRLEDAYNVRPDIGYVAETVKKAGIKGLNSVRARVGSPVLAELCQRLPNADEMIKKMGEVAVEPKYDGVRVQIHYQRTGSRGQGTVKTFSRNLENTTAMFSELSEIGSELIAHDVILDCEAVGMDRHGNLVSFQETTTRKRKHDIAAAIKNVPLKFFVFDILYKNGKDLLATPLVRRREILEQSLKPRKLLALSPQIITHDSVALRTFHDVQLRKGLEGVVVKKWNSLYEPGRRGYSWVKFKEEEGKTGKLTDTIDAVVMGYYFGEGKRTGFGIGAFLVGVRRGDGFVTVTKVGTGVSDELWKELRAKLHAINTRTQPKEYHEVNKLFTPDVWVIPKIVVEIAGDDLTKSSTHGAGFAVRFPRLVRIRTDKGPREATTASEMAQMFAGQKSNTKK